jgi:hypothetical protein
MVILMISRMMIDYHLSSIWYIVESVFGIRVVIKRSAKVGIKYTSICIPGQASIPSKKSRQTIIVPRFGPGPNHRIAKAPPWPSDRGRNACVTPDIPRTTRRKAGHECLSVLSVLGFLVPYATSSHFFGVRGDGGYTEVEAGGLPGIVLGLMAAAWSLSSLYKCMLAFLKAGWYACSDCYTAT